MNEHLKIPAKVNDIINQIETIDLNLVELPLPEHPLLTQFNRSIVVSGFDTKSKQEFIVFSYEQVLKNKETGEIVKIKLPNPEWAIYADTWSYLRDEKGNFIETSILEPDGKITKEKIKVPAYKYILYLMKNNKADILSLIKIYLADFIDAKIDELNKL